MVPEASKGSKASKVGGVLLYISYMGMGCCEGYYFQAVYFSRTIMLMKMELMYNRRIGRESNQRKALPWRRQIFSEPIQSQLLNFSHILHWWH